MHVNLGVNSQEGEKRDDNALGTMTGRRLVRQLPWRLQKQLALPCSQRQRGCIRGPFGEGGFEAFEGEGSKGGGGRGGAEGRKASKASKVEDEGLKGFESEDEGFEG